MEKTMVLRSVKFSASFMLFFYVSSAMAQQEKPVNIAALADSMHIQPKPVLVLISTDWCMYCGMQQAQLKKNADFQSAKRSFYYVELNAETKDSILFKGAMYRYTSNDATTGVHELAVFLGSQKEGLSYPTWVLMDQNYQILFKRNGILLPKELKIMLNAIKELNR